jgi:hypothetical protein
MLHTQREEKYAEKQQAQEDSHGNHKRHRYLLELRSARRIEQHKRANYK